MERQCGARQACLASSYRRGIRSLQQELSRAERKARPATPKAPAPAASQQAQVLLAALTETVRSSIAELVKQHDISRPKWSLIELKIVFSRLDRAAKDKLVAEVWDARTNLQADLFLRELATGPKAYPQAMGRGGKGTLPFGVERGRFPLGGKGTLPF